VVSDAVDAELTFPGLGGDFDDVGEGACQAQALAVEHFEAIVDFESFDADGVEGIGSGDAE